MLLPFPLNLPGYTPTISLGSLFDRLGKIGHIVDLINTHVGATIPGEIDDLAAMFAGDQDQIDRVYSSLTTYQGTPTGYLSSLKTLAATILVAEANAPSLLPDNRLSTALGEVIRQMSLGGKTVSANVVGGSVASDSSNYGNPVFVVSTKATVGVTLENILAESFVGTCVADSATGGVSAGRERIRFVGQQSAANSIGHLFPRGSGSTFTATCVSPLDSEFGGTANYLNNSDFETWTAPNVPDGFGILTGTAGTTVLKSTASVYRGSASLRFAGNGVERTAIAQIFGVGTDVEIDPLTQFAFNLRIRVDSVPAAGKFEVALVDSGGSILNDAAGAANSVVVDLTTIGTGWRAVNGAFRTPRIVPSGSRLRLRLETPLTSGVNLFMDSLALAQMIQPYPQGFHVAAFSGDSDLVLGDSFVLTATNDRGGQFQTLFDRLFNMRNLGFMLPSTTGTPTYANSLIS